MRATGGSRTAVLVCQGRAVADGRIAPGRFTDPVAVSLLRADERRTVEQVRAGAPPAGWLERVDYESVRACAAVLVPRTIAIDDAVRERPSPQVVLLGAGLDGRAWRMPELAGRVVFEVDHPDSARDKRERLAESPAAARPVADVRFVAVDLGRDRLGNALAAAGHQTATPTTWIWEGVVPYLTRPEAARTVAAVAALSAPGSRLIVNYQAPQAAIAAGRLIARSLDVLARRRGIWADEPWRSRWTAPAMRDLLGGDGFIVHGDDDLLTIATRLAAPTPRRAALRSGRVAVADRPA
ncbi:class I SAM-dependent methyltransferase [Parafrankia discariae]|uniref:class I SAM-dependent methyltransferase n=1 Tax=Parafrankia discariae TaxID=365528 RepID=UPI00047790F9|nr:class I SAM-dependent methyltransferase [Parafrankia discariae]